jgi:hypothetical protein
VWNGVAAGVSEVATALVRLKGNATEIETIMRNVRWPSSELSWTQINMRLQLG